MGFDKNAGSNYVYPNSTDKYPFREYQYKICKEAFFQNTLVVLPDGLGKSFIASVVMYNIYRWYPMSKVIFLSASKSILKGQMEACWNIMNIPKGDCVEITGKSPSARVDIWKKYRVIFGTPRQILSDFREVNSLPFLRIKLLVITEAHKARGSNNPFAHIIDILHGQNEYFRILAHTSVIGKKTSEIAEVVRHLRISHVEIRQENSPDIAEYVRKNTIKPLEVEINEEFRTIKDEFLTSIDPFLRTLLANVNVPGTLSKSRLITAKKKFTEASMTEKHTNYAHVISTFDICIDLYHAVELLDDYGIVSFINYLESEVLMESPKAGDEKLREFIEKLKGTFPKMLIAQ
uniref:Uncharacterized protein n=1 Tax=Phlebotomus papatasi TaxID=29031 RepID=A0A1B0DCA3_PHLPP